MFCFWKFSFQAPSTQGPFAGACQETRMFCSVLFGKRSRETLLQGPLGHVLTYGILWEPQTERLHAASREDSGTPCSHPCI